MENINIFSETFKHIKSEEVESVQLEACEKDKDCLEVATVEVSPDMESKRNKFQISCINSEKSSDMIGRLCHAEHFINASDLELELIENDNINENVSTNELEVSFDDLWENKKVPKKKKFIKIKTQKINEQEEAMKKELMQIITKGDTHKLSKLLHNMKLTEGENHDFFNKIVDDHSNTLLHLAALKEQTDMITYLLCMKADPSLKNKYQKTAYTCTQSEKVREAFINYANRHFGHYHEYYRDYYYRDIPYILNFINAKIPVDPGIIKTMAKVNKEVRKIEKEKEKNRLKMAKLENTRERTSESEKSTARCLLCNADLAGKVSFKYMEKLFCSSECFENSNSKNVT